MTEWHVRFVLKVGQGIGMKIARSAAIILTVLAVTLAVTLQAAPYGTNIPLPSNTIGSLHRSGKYAIDYDSFFGGHWHLNGTRKDHHDGTHVDAFHGTITDLNINGTFTKTSSFMWMSDSWYLDSSHTWVSCDSFTINISNGHVHGTATFRAP